MDLKEFEEQWTELGKKICQAVYTNSEIQNIKSALQKNGFLSLEEKSKFIDICDGTKYNIIYKTFGKEDSKGYADFSKHWKSWFQEKGVGSGQARGQRNSVDHILYGSTPDPIQFLLHFEQEMLGSMAEKK